MVIVLLHIPIRDDFKTLLKERAISPDINIYDTTKFFLYRLVNCFLFLVSCYLTCFCVSCCFHFFLVYFIEIPQLMMIKVYP